MSKEEDCKYALMEGKDDARTGKNFDDTPYPIGTAEYGWWAYGWRVVKNAERLPAEDN